jgi:hexosaminidase
MEQKKLPVLIPVPRSLCLEPGIFSAGKVWRRKVADYTIDSELPDAIELSWSETRESSQGHDYYALKIKPDGIAIKATGRQALFHGMKTLHQILLNYPEEAVPCLSLEDWADFPVRGLMLDISRDRVPGMKTLFRVIDICALIKMNHLQLYMEHTFAYKGHERVWKDASPLTPGEIREIDAYCTSRGIELVPNQNSFGHMERWLKYPEYQELAESPGGFTDPWGVFRPEASTLSPVSEKVFPFLEELYDQLLPNFSSNLFNVGGDEPWELGAGKSRDLCGKIGIERVYLNFLLALYNLVSRKGRKMMIWADIVMKYPGIIDELPEDIILVNWGYEADHPFDKECALLSSSGREYYICTGTSAWNSIGGRWENCRQNIESAAAAALRNGASGFLVSEWGDNGHWQQFPIQFPGYLYGAAAAWNGKALDNADLSTGLALFCLEGSRPLAEALMLLEKSGQAGNRGFQNITLPGAILVDHLGTWYRRDIEGFRGHDFSSELSLLARADALLEAADAEITEDGREELMLFQELKFTSRLLRFACSLGRLRLATENLDVMEIDKKNRNSLAEELGRIIIEYKRLWLLRSRPGGFRESADRFEALKELLLSDSTDG